MMAVHAMRGPVRSPADAAKGDAKLKELFFFDMLAHGIWLARRGMFALSLPIGDAECDKLAGAVRGVPGVAAVGAGANVTALSVETRECCRLPSPVIAS